MSVLTDKICCGCLRSDRKTTCFEEVWKKQNFLDIINAPHVFNIDDLPIRLCWECEVLVYKFTRFKQQVTYAYQLLCNQSKISTNHVPKSELKQFSNLTTHVLYNFELQETYQDIDQFEVINAAHKYIDIKQEIDNASDYSDNDNSLLTEYTTKRKKKKYAAGVESNADETEFKRKRKKKEKVTEVYKEVELTEDEVLEERRLLALKEEYANAMFKCSRCLISFTNGDDFKDHTYVKHEMNASLYKCVTCECSFVSEMSYNYHKNKHTKRYECASCLERFTSKRSVTKHYDTVHCHSFSLEYQLQLQDNGEQHTENKERSVQQESASFPCDFCDKTFRWKTSLRKHLETHKIETGQKRKPYCEPCRLSFTTTSNLQKHVKTSSKHQIQLKLRKLKESLAPDTTNPEKEQAHIEQIKCSVNRSRQTFGCSQCDKKFQWRGNLLRHLHSHTARANGELVCAPCNRTFSSIATYKQHMKISKKHVSENDFKYICSECGKRFANKTRLKDHVDWEHLKNFTHVCSHCQKVFKSHTSLYLHKQVVHKKTDAEHLCDHCGKAFPNKAKLRSHMVALHSGEAPYRCPRCAARFSWHSCLSRHVRRVHRRHKHDAPA